MPKISALPPMTTPDAADEAPIVDTSVTTTKKWTLTLLKTYLQSLSAWVTSTMVVGINKSLLTVDVNPYRFKARRNAAQNSGNGAFAIINFDTEFYDPNSNFDITTNVGRYTCPVTGVYKFTSRVSVSIAGQGLIGLYKNGALLERGGHGLGTGTIGVNIATEVEATAGDYFEVFCFAGGAALEVSSYVGFSGYLLSRT